MARILLVEDDDDLILNYSDLLNSAGFDVITASDKASTTEKIGSASVDLVLLDIMLGNDVEAGFALCGEIRKRSETLPIIFLTSLDSDIDKITGMRIGADDYITKDISNEYLLARIKALLRRVEILSGKYQQTSDELQLGDLVINLDTCFASWKKTPLSLKVTQVWILHALASNPNRLRSVQQLMDAAKATLQPNTIAIHIMTIRKAFQAIDPDFKSIQTQRGVGYRWVTEN